MLEVKEAYLLKLLYREDGDKTNRTQELYFYLGQSATRYLPETSMDEVF